MNILLYGIAAIIGFSLLIAVIYPCFAVYFRDQLSQDLVVAAKRHLLISIFVLLVLFSKLFGISLPYHSLNILVVFIAFIGGFFLVMFSFNLNIKAFHISIVGTLSIFGWFLIMVIQFVSLDNIDPKTVDIGGDMYCRRASWGWGGSDAGETIEVFKQYLIIDKLMISKIYNYSTQGESSISAEESETINRCQAAFAKISKIQTKFSTNKLSLG
jgi:hypothetical protein